MTKVLIIAFRFWLITKVFFVYWLFDQPKSQKPTKSFAKHTVGFNYYMNIFYHFEYFGFKQSVRTRVKDLTWVLEVI